MAINPQLLKKRYSDFLTRQGLTPKQLVASAKSVKQNLQNFKTELNRPGLSKPLQAPARAIEKVYNTRNPIIRIPTKLSQGAIEGSNLGITKMGIPDSRNRIESAAYGVGSAVGMLNPKNLVNRTILGAGGKSQAGVTKALSKTKLPNLVKKIAPVVAREATQTAAATALFKGAGQDFDSSKDLAFGLGVSSLGPTGRMFAKNSEAIAKAFKTVSPNANKVHPEDLKTMEQFVKEVLMKGRQKVDLGDLGVDAARMAEHYLGKNWRNATNKELASQFNQIILRSKGIKGRQINTDMLRGIKGVDTPQTGKGFASGVPPLQSSPRQGQGQVRNSGMNSNIPQELIQEARKYKNAEEFVQNMDESGIVFYRGEGPASKGGNYYTRDMEFANEFNQKGFHNPDMLTKVFIPEEKIYRPSVLPGATNESEVSKAIAEAKKKGFSAVYVDEGSPFGEPVESVFVIDKNLPKKLDDLYNQAQQPTSTLSDLQKSGLVSGFAGGGQPRRVTKVNPVLAKGYQEIGQVADDAPISVRKTMDDFYTNWVDRFHPINKLVNKVEQVGKQKGFELIPEKNPKNLTRRLTGAAGIAEQRHQAELKPVLDEIEKLGIAKEDMDLFLKSRRDINLAGRGIKGSDAAVANERIQALVEKYGGDRFSQVAEKLYTYQRKGFEELAQAGFLDPETAKRVLDMNQDYVPFQRVMDEIDDYLGMPTRKLQNPDQPVKKIQGSDRQILSPLESIIANTYKQRAAIEKNRVAQSIVNLRQLVPELGIAPASKSGDNTISVWEGGKKRFYTVPEEIAQTVKGLNEEPVNTLIKILSAPASLLRRGATGSNPEFIIPNVIRDQFDAAINAKYGYTPFVDWVRGMASVIKKDETYQQWLQSGASQQLGDIVSRKSIRESITEKTGKERALVKLAKWVGGKIDAASNVAEQSTRVGVFKRALEATGNKTIAGMESRDATIDFSRMGAKMKVANMLVPFLNVSVQATDKLVRNAKTNPAKAAMGIGLYGALPAAAVTAYNMLYHRQEYAEIPEWEKEGNLVFVSGRDAEGKVDYFKIPLGNVAKLGAAPMRSFVEYLNGNDQQGFASLAYEMLGETLPLVEPGNTGREVITRSIGANLPQFLKPAAEDVVNKSFYKWDAKKGEPAEIVPFYLKDKPAGEQTFESTPMAYNAIGRALDVSPLRVRNFLEGHLAGFAKIPVNLIEVMNDVANGKEVNPNELLLLRRFIGEAKPPAGSTQLTQQKKERAPLIPQASADEGMTTKQLREYAKAEKIERGTPEAIRKAAKLLDDQKLTDNQRKQLYGNMGVTLNQAGYYKIADMPVTDRSQFIASRITGEVDNQLLQILATLKRPMAGKAIVTNDVIDDLETAGILSDAQAKQLKRVKWDAINNKLITSAPTGKGKGRGKKVKKVRVPKIVTATPTVRVSRRKSRKTKLVNPLTRKR